MKSCCKTVDAVWATAFFTLKQYKKTAQSKHFELNSSKKMVPKVGVEPTCPEGARF